MTKVRKSKNFDSSENVRIKDLKIIKKKPITELKKVKKELVKDAIKIDTKVVSKVPKTITDLKNVKKDYKKVEKKTNKNKRECSNDINRINNKFAEEENIIDLKRAKLEVLQFGLRGLKGDDKEKGLVDMLVGLGAKPPKNKFINYKELQQQRQENKKKELELRKSMAQFGGNFLKKLPKEYNKNKKTRELNFGKMKDGVMKVPVGLKGQKPKGMVRMNK